MSFKFNTYIMPILYYIEDEVIGKDKTFKPFAELQNKEKTLLR